MNEINKCMYDMTSLSGLQELKSEFRFTKIVNM